MRIAFRVFLGFFTAALKNYRQYAANLAFKVMTYPIEVALYLSLWTSIFASGTFPAGPGGVVPYYLTVLLLARLASPFPIVEELENSINSGDMVGYYVRPIPYWTVMAGRSLATFCVNLVLLFPLVLGVMVFFHELDPQPVRILQFLALLVPSNLIHLAIYSSVGMLTFWLERVWGLAFMVSFLTSFLSGFTIPLWIFPDWLATVALALPFHFLFHTPVQALLIGLGPVEFFLTLAQELLWIAVLAWCCRGIWEAGRRKFSGHGT